MKNKTTKAILLGVAICLTAGSMFAQTPSLLWTKRWGNTTGADFANAMVVDASNNVYVVGMRNGGVFNEDMAILKYNAAGTLLWSQIKDGTLTQDYDYAYAVAVDASGNVYVTGNLAQNSPQDMDMVTIKFNSSGTTLWTKYYGGAAGQFERGMSIQTDGNNVYVAGSAYDALKVIQYNAASGSQQWVYTYNGTGTARDEAKDLILDVANNGLFVTGSTDVTGQGYNAITARIDTATGNQNWLQLYNGAANLNDEGYDISLESNGGQLAMCGYTRASSTNKNGLLAKYLASNGQALQSTTYNGANNLDDVFESVFVEHLNNDGTPHTYVTGYTTVAANPNPEDKDMITRKYDTNLNVLWSVIKDGTLVPPETNLQNEADAGTSITLSPWTGKLYVAGTIMETGQQTNYITLRYNASTGVQEWSAMYNHASFMDDVYTKYDLAVSFDACHNWDYVHVTGGSSTNAANTDFDIATLKYGLTGPCSQAPGQERFADNAEEGNVPTVTGILYPSPFNEQATLKIYYEQEIKNAEFVIYDMMGKQAERITNFANYEIIIARGNLRSGIYVYKLVINNKDILSDKFIITD